MKHSRCLGGTTRRGGACCQRQRLDPRLRGDDGGARFSARLGVALLFAFAIAPPPLRAQSSQFFFSGDGAITLAHAHFAERLQVRYRDAAGHYDAEALARIARFFRSRDDGQVGEVSLRLIELIDYVQDRYHPTTTTLLSGYRSPAFNQRLRDSGAQAADSSLHIDGIAADLQFTGVGLKQLWIDLREERIGGVGYYARQSFLHLDTGRPRFWEPQTSRVNEHLSAGNARVFARTDFDRYRNLTGAIVRLHSVTALPLHVSSSGRVGADTIVLAPLDDAMTVADECIVIATPAAAYRLRIAHAPDVTLKQRAAIVLRTCPPRVEATPETIESNAIEVIP